MSIAEYIDFAVAQHVRRGSANPADLIRQICTKYMQTAEGRQKFAVSHLEPTRLRLAFKAQCLKTGKGVGGLKADFATMADDATDEALLLEMFLKAIPEEEKGAEPYRQLRTLVGDLKGVRDECVRRCSSGGC